MSPLQSTSVKLVRFVPVQTATPALYWLPAVSICTETLAVGLKRYQTVNRLPQKLCGSLVSIVAPLVSAVLVAGSVAIGAAAAKLSFGGGGAAATGAAVAIPRVAARSATRDSVRVGRVIGRCLECGSYGFLRAILPCR